jgi:hypothetical protein
VKEYQPHLKARMRRDTKVVQTEGDVKINHENTFNEILYSERQN